MDKVPGQNRKPYLIKFEQTDKGKEGLLEAELISGEKITLKFSSRFQGKIELLKKALSAKNYEDLYTAISRIPSNEMEELTNDEIVYFIENNPEGYTLDDYKKSYPEGGLKTENNPIGVEYTLTFGTDKGKEKTHGPSIPYHLQLELSKYQRAGEGQSEEAIKIIHEMRKWWHMHKDYEMLSGYAHPERYKNNPELQKKIVAEIRSFRSLHSWVYEEIKGEHERQKQPKKKFEIKG